MERERESSEALLFHFSHDRQIGSSVQPLVPIPSPRPLLFEQLSINPSVTSLRKVAENGLWEWQSFFRFALENRLSKGANLTVFLLLLFCDCCVVVGLLFSGTRLDIVRWRRRPGKPNWAAANKLHTALGSSVDNAPI